MKLNLIEILASASSHRVSRGRILWALAVCVTGLVGVPAMGAETATGGGPLRVGVSPVFPPMVFKQGKELAGVEVDLAKALGKQLGREVVFVEMEWKEQAEALMAGKTDIIMSSMSVTPARSSILLFTQPYLRIGQMALVRREDRVRHALGLMVPAGTKVGVLKDTTGDFLVQRDFPKAKRKVFKNSDDVAKALMRGDVAMFVADSTLVWYLAGIHANEGLTAAGPVLSEELLAWPVRRGDEELAEAVNRFVARATKDGSLTKTFRRWMAME